MGPNELKQSDYRKTTSGEFEVIDLVDSVVEEIDNPPEKQKADTKRGKAGRSNKSADARKTSGKSPVAESPKDESKPETRAKSATKSDATKDTAAKPSGETNTKADGSDAATEAAKAEIKTKAADAGKQTDKGNAEPTVAANTQPVTAGTAGTDTAANTRSDLDAVALALRNKNKSSEAAGDVAPTGNSRMAGDAGEMRRKIRTENLSQETAAILSRFQDIVGTGDAKKTAIARPMATTTPAIAPSPSTPAPSVPRSVTSPVATPTAPPAAAPAPAPAPASTNPAAKLSPAPTPAKPDPAITDPMIANRPDALSDLPDLPAVATAKSASAAEVKPAPDTAIPDLGDDLSDMPVIDEAAMANLVEEAVAASANGAAADVEDPNALQKAQSDFSFLRQTVRKLRYKMVGYGIDDAESREDFDAVLRMLSHASVKYRTMAESYRKVEDLAQQRDKEREKFEAIDENRRELVRGIEKLENDLRKKDREAASVKSTFEVTKHELEAQSRKLGAELQTAAERENKAKMLLDEAAEGMDAIRRDLEAAEANKKEIEEQVQMLSAEADILRLSLDEACEKIVMTSSANLQSEMRIQELEDQVAQLTQTDVVEL